MKERYGGGGDSSGGALWEVVVAILLILIATAVFAEQGEHRGKHYNIHGNAVDRKAVENLLDDSLEDGEAKMYPDGKTISEVKGRFGIDKNKPVKEATLDFIDRHRNAFGLKNPKEELKKESTEGLNFQQTYNGIPVWGRHIKVHFNQDYNISLIQSNIVPTPDIDTTPMVGKDEAVEIACADKISEKGGKTGKPITFLFIYENTLAYRVRFLYLAHSWVYWIDAKTGKIITKYDETHYDGAVMRAESSSIS